ncbi:MAG: acylphosphatase [Burkholderiales bacterium]|nr:MAG: acylphosphatase [Burkholderiales bacterium]
MVAVDTRAVHLLIEGRVQGVGYRQGLQRDAQRLGLAGWVRNLPDGRVEAWCEGAAADVTRLVGWCRRGPPAATVAGLRASERELQGHAGFDVRCDL